jgi:N-acetylneuraminic acid mutarotase
VNGDATTPSWYYAKTGAVDGQQVGPVSWEQLVSLSQTGALSATDLVWNPQFPSWVTVAEVPGLLAPPLPRMGSMPQETGRPPGAQPTAIRPGAVQPTAARPGAIQPAPRQAARPSAGYDPFLDEGEPSDFGGERSWLRWGMAIGAVVVIGIIVGVYFGVIRGGATPATTTLAPTTSVLETTTSDTEPAVQAVWTDLAATGTLPPARSEHAVAYDATNGVVILFGGWDKANTTFNDTWLFDSNTRTWTAAATTGKLPAARAQHQMVSDTLGGKVIMFGGILKADGTQLKDTWAYDPATKTWADKKPAGTVPSARSSFSMVYDELNQRIILFGGWSKATSAHLNDTWAYDPATNTWTDLKPTGDVPTARGSQAMAYDQVEGKVVLFGGTDSSAYFNDTYVYDYPTNAWTKVTAAGEVPPLRAGARMEYDPTSGVVVLFGGWDGTAYYNDTWTFATATSTWTALNITGGPSARDSHSLIYDAASNKLILFGGFVGGTDVAQDTWSFGVSDEIPTETTTLPPTGETTTTDLTSGATTTLEP